MTHVQNDVAVASVELAVIISGNWNRFEVLKGRKLISFKEMASQNIAYFDSPDFEALSSTSGGKGWIRDFILGSGSTCSAFGIGD